MKTILSTAALFVIAGVCFGTPQPSLTQNPSAFRALLTYSNLNAISKCKVAVPKIYVVSDQPVTVKTAPTPAPAPSTTSGGSDETFYPTPLINFYKELRYK